MKTRLITLTLAAFAIVDLRVDAASHKSGALTPIHNSTRRGAYFVETIGDTLHQAPPQNTHLGGDIYIHGNGAQSDWTWGCVALENQDVRELFQAVSIGTPVTIQP